MNCGYYIPSANACWDLTGKLPFSGKLNRCLALLLQSFPGLVPAEQQGQSEGLPRHLHWYLSTACFHSPNIAPSNPRIPLPPGTTAVPVGTAHPTWPQAGTARHGCHIPAVPGSPAALIPQATPLPQRPPRPPCRSDQTFRPNFPASACREERGGRARAARRVSEVAVRGRQWSDDASYCYCRGGESWRLLPGFLGKGVYLVFSLSSGSSSSSLLLRGRGGG